MKYWMRNVNLYGVAANPQSWPGKPFSLMRLKEEEQVVVKKILWSRHCGKCDCWNKREDLQEDLQLFGSMFGLEWLYRQAATCLKKLKTLSQNFPCPLQVVLTDKTQLCLSFCALN